MDELELHSDVNRLNEELMSLPRPPVTVCTIETTNLGSPTASSELPVTVSVVPPAARVSIGCTFVIAGLDLYVKVTGTDNLSHLSN